MKKIICFLLVVCIFTSGCGKTDSKNVVNRFKKKMNQSSGYQIKGKLSIQNNDEVYHYDVEAFHKKDHYYKVALTNTANNHTQIILKNDEGVYVLTPALNKSFRFQSDWPYPHSQVYLLDALLTDLENDSEKKFQVEKDHYVFQLKCNYPTNSKFVRQKLEFSSDLKPEKVSVYDSNDVEVMTMEFKKVKYSPKLSKEDFNIEDIMDKKSYEKVQETSSIEDIIYPLFVPEGTKLIGEEKIEKTNGERVIMNYDGEKSFLLVEETADVFDELTIIPTSGEPYFLMDTLGIMTNNSLSWTSGGIDYYLVSDVMSSQELVPVAQSISGIVSMK